MAPPTFYLAIGREYRLRDLDISLAAGQRHFLVTAGSLAARRLRETPDVHVALDCEAFPPNNPRRISLDTYWRAVLAWRRRDGSWDERLDWFSSYDTIGNLTQTVRDGERLRTLIARDAPDAPLMPCIGYPAPVETVLEAVAARPLPGQTRPSYGVGGLAVARYSNDADAWLTDVLAALDTLDDAVRDGIRLHLFGISKPSWVLRSELITSCDSSGPARMAAIAGWGGIVGRYSAAYGVSAEKLQLSREARLAYWLASTRRSLGLPWRRVDEALFLDDARAPAGLQTAYDLYDLDALPAAA